MQKLNGNVKRVNFLVQLLALQSHCRSSWPMLCSLAHWQGLDSAQFECTEHTAHYLHTGKGLNFHLLSGLHTAHWLHAGESLNLPNLHTDTHLHTGRGLNLVLLTSLHCALSTLARAWIYSSWFLNLHLNTGLHTGWQGLEPTLYLILLNLQNYTSLHNACTLARAWICFCSLLEQCTQLESTLYLCQPIASHFLQKTWWVLVDNVTLWPMPCKLQL